MPGSNHGDQLCGTEGLQVVIVHPVVEAAIALRVHAVHSDDLQRRTVRKDDVCPDDQHQALAEQDPAVVAAEQLRSLRNEKKVPRRAVVDVLAHLCRDATGKIAVDA